MAEAAFGVPLFTFPTDSPQRSVESQSPTRSLLKLSSEGNQAHTLNAVFQVRETAQWLPFSLWCCRDSPALFFVCGSRRASGTKKGPAVQQVLMKSSNDLIFRAVARKVPSAQMSLTSVFGMGTGGASSPSSLLWYIYGISPGYISRFSLPSLSGNLTTA